MLHQAIEDIFLRACALCISEVEQQPIFELRNAKTYSAIFAFCGSFKYVSELLVSRIVFIEDHPGLIAGPQIAVAFKVGQPFVCSLE